MTTAHTANDLPGRLDEVLPLAVALLGTNLQTAYAALVLAAASTTPLLLLTTQRALQRDPKLGLLHTLLRHSTG